MATTIGRQWLVFELAEQLYGFDARHVREIVSMQNLQIHRVPQMPEFVEGIVSLRDQAIAVFDVRSAMGRDSLRMEREEITKMLNEREEDHCRWITELEACVREQREFRLATDPHKCKFGLWYDQLLADPRSLSRFTHNDLALIDLLERLDQPHQRIHAIAQRVVSHADAGRKEDAQKIIDNTRGRELNSLRQLFFKCREVVRRGLLFVLTVEGDVFGALVDRVCEVARFSEDQILPVDCAGVTRDLIAGAVPWGDTGKMVQLLRVAAIAGRAAGLTCSV